MKPSRFSLRGLLFAGALIASLVVPPGTASAASSYDNVLAPTTSAKVSDTYGDHTCSSHDLSIAWDSYIMDDSKWNQAVYAGGTNREMVQSAFSAALDNGGGWAVTEIEFRSAGASIGNFAWGPNNHGVQIMLTPDADNETTFFTYGGLGYAALKGTGSSPVYVVVLGQYWNSATSSCSIGVAVSRAITSDASPGSFVSNGAYLGYDNPDPNANYVYRQLFINSPIAYPLGYTGQLVPVNKPVAKYVAMGDSFSSGEGNPTFEAGTDKDGVNKCHRSPQAYSRLLQNGLKLGPTAFVACSGATTANVLGGQWDEPAQLDALTSATEEVTLTIGGNDAGFGSYILGCVVACGPGTPIYDAMLAGINQPAFRENLEYTYTQILAIAPNAELYVADYPYLAAASVTACQGLDFSGAYEVQTALNAVIQTAVGNVAASNSRIHYVPTNYASSPFTNGELCGGSGPSLFHGLVPHMLHPNAAGHQAYAAVFAEAIG